jgi:hypothetical protein
VPARGASRSASGGEEPLASPQLPDAQRTFVSSGAQAGSRRFSDIPRIEPGTLEVAVICSGSGTVDVNVGSFVSYTVECRNGDPGQYNEVALREGHKKVALSVTSRTTGSWGLSVGWAKAVRPDPQLTWAEGPYGLQSPPRR